MHERRTTLDRATRYVRSNYDYYAYYPIWTSITHITLFGLVVAHITLFGLVFGLSSSNYYNNLWQRMTQIVAATFKALLDKRNAYRK